MTTWKSTTTWAKKVPAAIYPTREQCERFIQKSHRQDRAMSEVTNLARTALTGWLTDLAANYNLGLKDLNELVWMGVEDALRGVLPA
jgi:hypothetical protein